MIAHHLAIQRLAHEAAEQRCPTQGNFAFRTRLIHQQFEVIGRAVQVQLAGMAPQFFRQHPRLPGGVFLDEFLDLRVGKLFDPHLRHGQGFGGQLGAVIQHAAGEDHPVAGTLFHQACQKVPPGFDVLDALVGHFVEGVQQQDQPAFPQQRIQRGEFGIPVHSGGPVLFQPGLRGRQLVAGGGFVKIERYEKGQWNRVRLGVAPVQGVVGIIHFDVLEQRALARSRRPEQHQGRVGYCRQHFAQILELAGLRRPAGSLRFFALIEQQGQMDKALVQRVAGLRPAIDAGLVIAPEGRPAGSGVGVRQVYRGRSNGQTHRRQWSAAELPSGAAPCYALPLTDASFTEDHINFLKSCDLTSFKWRWFLHCF